MNAKVAHCPLQGWGWNEDVVLQGRFSSACLSSILHSQTPKPWSGLPARLAGPLLTVPRTWERDLQLIRALRHLGQDAEPIQARGRGGGVVRTGVQIPWERCPFPFVQWPIYFHNRGKFSFQCTFCFKRAWSKCNSTIFISNTVHIASFLFIMIMESNCKRHFPGYVCVCLCVCIEMRCVCLRLFFPLPFSSNIFNSLNTCRLFFLDISLHKCWESSPCPPKIINSTFASLQ